MFWFQLVKTLYFSNLLSVGWLWRTHINFGGPTNRMVNWEFIQCGCSSKYLCHLQTLSCRGTLFLALLMQERLPEILLPPLVPTHQAWCHEGKGPSNHRDTNISSDGQHRKYLGSRRARSQLDFFLNHQLCKIPSEIQFSLTPSQNRNSLLTRIYPIRHIK